MKTLQAILLLAGTIFFFGILYLGLVEYAPEIGIDAGKYKYNFLDEGGCVRRDGKPCKF